MVIVTNSTTGEQRENAKVDRRNATRVYSIDIPALLRALQKTRGGRQPVQAAMPSMREGDPLCEASLLHRVRASVFWGDGG